MAFKGQTGTPTNFLSKTDQQKQQTRARANKRRRLKKKYLLLKKQQENQWTSERDNEIVKLARKLRRL